MRRLVEDKPFDDIEELNAYVRKVLNDPAADPGPETDPMWRAQELLWSAYESEDLEEAARLAREALAIYPDSADAYVILAQQASSLDESIRLLEQGVAAGERSLGPTYFEEEKGHFWGILETRPYIRARYALARELWEAERAEEAVAHLQAVLELNEADNLGARYSLVNWLLALGRIDEAGRLLFSFDDPSCRWTYPKVLWAYLKEGDSPNARRLFNEAFASNPVVMHEFLELIEGGPEHFHRMSESIPDVYAVDSPEEARLYLSEGLNAWVRAPKAALWLVEQVQRALRFMVALGDPAFSAAPRIRRNDPCPCGSGRKYKQCCVGIV